MAASSRPATLLRMLESGEFSDLTFSCDGEEFKVHKAVVCSLSPVIKRMVLGNFTEAQTNVIKMDEFPVCTVRRMVHYMYSDWYDDPTGPEDSPDLEKQVFGSGDDGAEPGSKRPRISLDEAPSYKEIRDLALASAAAAGPLPAPAPSIQFRTLRGHHGISYDFPEIMVPPPMGVYKLYTHVSVNAIAEYYQIDGLVQLSTNRLRSLRDNTKNDPSYTPGLPVACRVAVDSTGDRTFLKYLAQMVVDKPSLLRHPEAFEEAGVISDFAAMLLKECASKMREADRPSLTWKKRSWEV